MTIRRRALEIGSVAAAMALAVGASTVPAQADASVQFTQSFANSTIDPAYPMFKPTMSSLNFACLTAATVLSPTELGKCPDMSPVPDGSGVLLLTPSANNMVGSAMSSNPLNATEGLDIDFDTHQWSSETSPADGIGFVLAAVDPNSPVPSANGGPAGGSLGYSASHEFVTPVDGYANGYLGVGFDVYGNFLNPQFQGAECANQSWQPASGTQSKNQITVRGPGNELTGYCALQSTANPALGLTQPVMHATTESGSKVPVNISINPTGKAFKNSAGVTLEPGTYRVTFTGVGQAKQSFAGELPNASGILPASWLNDRGVPHRMVFGWTASTGGFKDNHAIANARAASLTPVPDVATVRTSQTYKGKKIAKKNFSVKTSAPGATGTTNTDVTRKACGVTRGDVVNPACAATVTYRAKVTGAALNGKVKFVATLPKSLKAVGVTKAAGWKCKKNSGTKLTCTSKASTFAAGKSLKPVVLAVVKR